MQVNLSFDTENERLENLKKLVNALQQLVTYRESKISPNFKVPQAQQQQRTHPAYQQQVQTPAPQPIPQPIQQPIQEPVQQSAPQPPKQEERQQGKTGGGCRVVPYEDMSDTMSKIFSRR